MTDRTKFFLWIAALCFIAAMGATSGPGGAFKAAAAKHVAPQTAHF
jgi:hypothetical protein